VAEHTLLVGKAKELEVASQFTRHGLVVYVPLVNLGADLVIADPGMQRPIPVQIKFRAKSSAIDLNRTFVETFQNTDLVLAFIIGGSSNTGSWYILLKEFIKKKKDPPERRDDRLYITVAKTWQWLKTFEGDSGIQYLQSTLWPNHAFEGMRLKRCVLQG
jgi:hypothetical protein